MSIHLQQIRVNHTTANVATADTDANVFLEFFIDPHDRTTHPELGWQKVALDSSRDDRQRGKAETYEIDLTSGTIEINVGGIRVPRGIAFDNFEMVRRAVFFLSIDGPDWWQAENYRLEGRFREIRNVPGRETEIVDLGWLVMARRSEPLGMSIDSSEGDKWHHINIDGDLPA